MNYLTVEWYCAVALVYLATFTVSMALLVSDWRRSFGPHVPVPWGVVFLICLLGPLGLIASLTIYAVGRMK